MMEEAVSLLVAAEVYPPSFDGNSENDCLIKGAGPLGDQTRQQAHELGSYLVFPDF